jgi:hypothetical protein
MGLLSGVQGFVLGFAVGFGTGVTVRGHEAGIKNTLRPMAKWAMKSSLTMAEKSKEAMARFGEAVQDLSAEVRNELKTRREKPETRVGKKMKTGAIKRKRKVRVATVTPIREVSPVEVVS